MKRLTAAIILGLASLFFAVNPAVAQNDATVTARDVVDRRAGTKTDKLSVLGSQRECGKGGCLPWVHTPARRSRGLPLLMPTWESGRLWRRSGRKRQNSDAGITAS